MVLARRARGVCSILAGAFWLMSACQVVFVAPVAAQAVVHHDFRIANGAFLLDGKPLEIISGELHYARIPREYWRQRLKMAKAMGLNTIATYVFWNYHEIRPGVFDFHSGNRDLAEFLRLAQEQGLWVILRPGPYVCAEWDFGGLPSYLLKSPAIAVRSNDPRYLAAAERYVNAMANQVRPLLVTHGGPVLMVQVENEYGSFGADSSYKEATRRMLVDAGIDVPLFTADGDWLFDKGAIRGVFAAANGETSYDTLVKRSDSFNKGTGPYMVAEFYPGWLTHWAEPFPVTPIDSFLPQYDSLLARGASVNLYMFHGGTNFGFTSGANNTKMLPIEPSMTSYDYDAPLSEAGWPTSKYYALREVIQRHVSYAIPAVPGLVPVIAIPAIRLTAQEDLMGLIGHITPVRASQPLAFEDLDQADGYVLYRHRFAEAANGTLEIDGLRDYAAVFMDGKRVATLDRRTGILSTNIKATVGARLDILVENMGRINYGAELGDNRKGLISPVVIGGVSLTDWSMYRLPFAIQPTLHGSTAPVDTASGMPVVYGGTFSLARVGDTFLDMRGWDKGIVFVNGHNLGRYWKVGPQQTLYLPGAWLHTGDNSIVVFEMNTHSTDPSVAGLRAPILTQLEIL